MIKKRAHGTVDAQGGPRVETLKKSSPRSISFADLITG